MIVNPVDDAPVATDDSYTTPRETALVVPAPGVLENDSDVDGDPITAGVATAPANGSLTPDVDGSFTYTPDRPHRFEPGSPSGSPAVGELGPHRRGARSSTGKTDV